MKKLLVILLALCLVLTVFSATAQEGNESYGLYVGGVEVTPDNEKDVLGNGTVSYNPESGLLTLKGAVVTGSTLVTDATGARKVAAIYAKNDLKISAGDKCAVGCFGTSMDDEAWYGVLCEGSLTIRGDSMDATTLKVVVYGTDGKLRVGNAYGIWCAGKLEVSSCYLESGCMEADEGFDTMKQHGIYCKDLLKANAALIVGYTADQALASGTVGIEIRNLEFDQSAIVGISGNSGFTFGGMLLPDEYQNLAYLGLFSSVESGDNYDGSGTKADQLSNFMQGNYQRKYVVIKPQSN